MPDKITRQSALDAMMEADQQPGQSQFYRYDRMLAALEAAGWGPTEPSDSPARGDVYVYRNTESLLTSRTKEVAPGVNVDSDDDGLVGVEVLDAIQVEIGGHPVVDGRVAATVLPPPPEIVADTSPADEPVGALRILGGDHLYVKLTQPASEPWHFVYCLGEQRYSGWQSNECMEGTQPADRIPVELAVPEPATDAQEGPQR